MRQRRVPRHCATRRSASWVARNRPACTTAFLHGFAPAPTSGPPSVTPGRGVTGAVSSATRNAVTSLADAVVGSRKTTTMCAPPDFSTRTRVHPAGSESGAEIAPGRTDTCTTQGVLAGARGAATGPSGRMRRVRAASTSGVLLRAYFFARTSSRVRPRMVAVPAVYSAGPPIHRLGDRRCPPRQTAFS